MGVGRGQVESIGHCASHDGARESKPRCGLAHRVLLVGRISPARPLHSLLLWHGLLVDLLNIDADNGVRGPAAAGARARDAALKKRTRPVRWIWNEASPQQVEARASCAVSRTSLPSG